MPEFPISIPFKVNAEDEQAALAAVVAKLKAAGLEGLLATATPEPLADARLLGWCTECREGIEFIDGAWRHRTDPKPGACDLTAPLPVDEEVELWCPYEGCMGEVAEIDKAVRWNKFGGASADAAGCLTAAWCSLGDSDFQHDRYACETCGREVTLPGAPVKDWG